MDIWFWVLSIVLTVLCGLYAQNKGRRAWLWVVVGLMLTPLVSGILLLFLKDVRAADEHGTIPKGSISNKLLGVIAAVAIVTVIGVALTVENNRAPIATAQPQDAAPTSTQDSQSREPAAQRSNGARGDSGHEKALADARAKQIRPETLVRFTQSTLACLTKDDLQEAMTYGTNGQETKMRAMMLSSENLGGTCVTLSANESYKVISAEYNAPDMPEMGLLEIVGKGVTQKNGMWTFSWAAVPIERR